MRLFGKSKKKDQGGNSSRSIQGGKENQRKKVTFGLDQNDDDEDFSDLTSRPARFGPERCRGDQVMTITVSNTDVTTLDSFERPNGDKFLNNAVWGGAGLTRRCVLAFCLEEAGLNKDVLGVCVRFVPLKADILAEPLWKSLQDALAPVEQPAQKMAQNLRRLNCGERGDGSGQVVSPWFCALDEKHRLLLVPEHGNLRVQAIDVATWKCCYLIPNLLQPRDVVLFHGFVLVSESTGGRISVFSPPPERGDEVTSNINAAPKARLRQRIGTMGFGDNCFASPHGMALLENSSTLIVADYRAHRILLVDLSMTDVPEDSTDPPFVADSIQTAFVIRHPNAVEVLEDGPKATLFVTAFEPPTGVFIYSCAFSSKPDFSLQRVVGQGLALPQGLCVLDSHLLVCEGTSGNGCLRVFSLSEEPDEFGCENVELGQGFFRTPVGVTRSRTGSLFITDADMHRIFIFLTD